MTRGITIGGIKPNTKRKFDHDKLHFKDPSEPPATSDEFLDHLLNLYESEKNEQ